MFFFSLEELELFPWSGMTLGQTHEEEMPFPMPLGTHLTLIL